MPERYVAFLRAINVGGHTVKMDSLRQQFVALGFANVETFIASGNVIFEASAQSMHALEQQIEAALHKALGYPVATFLRTIAELAAIAQYQPFPDTTPAGNDHMLYIAFLAGKPSDQAQQKLLSFTTLIDQFHIAGREVYWLCHTRSSESTFSGALLEKSLGMAATLRNATTVKKLAAKYG
jgi:uncharacterized protein (DUF1697 family)